mgnify:CR=1 FL=1
MKKPKINSVGWKHTRVDNNKTKPRLVASAAPYPITRGGGGGKTKEISIKNIGVKVLITNRIMGGGGGSKNMQIEWISLKYTRFLNCSKGWVSLFPSIHDHNHNNPHYTSIHDHNHNNPSPSTTPTTTTYIHLHPRPQPQQPLNHYYHQKIQPETVGTGCMGWRSAFGGCFWGTRGTSGVVDTFGTGSDTGNWVVKSKSCSYIVKG